MAALTRFLRYTGGLALFMGIVLSWMAVLTALMWAVYRVSPHWTLDVLGVGLIVVLGTSSLLYVLFETPGGRRFSAWFVRLGLGPPSREREDP